MNHEPPRHTAARELVDQLLAAWARENERLRALNEQLTGRRTQARPVLRVIAGGADAEAATD